MTTAHARGQHERSGRTNRLQLAVALVIAGGLTASCGGGRGRPAGSATPASGPLALADLAVGDCYIAGDDSATVAPLHSGATSTEQSGMRVPCTQSHTFEVFGRVDDPSPPGSPFPGIELILRRSDDACLPAYVGADYAAARFYARIRTPDAAGWAQGDRLYVCALYDRANTQLVGSARGSYWRYHSTAFDFGVSLPTTWSAQPRPNDPTGTVLSSQGAAVTVGIDALGPGHTQKALFDADVQYLSTRSAPSLRANDLVVGGITWNVVQYGLPTSDGPSFGIDALTVIGDKSIMLIWTSRAGTEASDLERFSEILQGFTYPDAD